jgi:hypothetical protein
MPRAVRLGLHGHLESSIFFVEPRLHDAHAARIGCADEPEGLLGVPVKPGCKLFFVGEQHRRPFVLIVSVSVLGSVVTKE